MNKKWIGVMSLYVHMYVRDEDGKQYNASGGYLARRGC